MSEINTEYIVYDEPFSSGPKPIKYILNDLNSSKYSREQVFPVVGNSRGVYVASEIERPIPTYTGRKTIEGFVLPFTTTPDYSLKSGVNPIDTTNDLILKTGLTMRNKKSGNDTSWRAYEIFGDSSVNPVIVQNAGQFRDPGVPVNKGSAPGYNREINRYANGVGVIWPEGQQCGVSSRNMMINIVNH